LTANVAVAIGMAYGPKALLVTPTGIIELAAGNGDGVGEALDFGTPLACSLDLGF